MMSTGRRAASMLTHARILRNADAADEGAHWSAADIAAALETSASTVPRVRQALVEAGLAAALERRKPSGRQDRTLDGA